MPTTRRTFTPEFKAEAVKLVTEQGRSFVEVARDLDIGESTLRGWRQALDKNGPNAFPGRGNPPALEEELRRPAGRCQATHDGARHPEKRDGLLRQGVVMRYDFIQRHQERWPVRTMCRVLHVSSGWLLRLARKAEEPQDTTTRGPGRGDPGRASAGQGALRQPEDSRRAGGSGDPCCVNTVAKLMRHDGIAAKTKRKFRVTTDSNHRRPVAENVLDRQFEPEAINQAWTADITYVATGEGWLYLAAVEDLHSRRIVGWSMSERIDSRLVVDALEMALAERQPGEGLGGPLGSWQPVRQRTLSTNPGQPRDHRQHEPTGQLLGQRADGELLREPEEGTFTRRVFRDESRGTSLVVRVHRGVLQPIEKAFRVGIPLAKRVRTTRIKR